MVFKKGQSGNPSGLPQKPESIARRQMSKDVRDLCRAHTLDAVNALIEVVNTKTTPPAARVAAANSILDRGWGKAPVHIDATVSSFERMSDQELIAFITGRVIDGEVIHEDDGDDTYQDEDEDAVG